MQLTNIELRMCNKLVSPYVTKYSHLENRVAKRLRALDRRPPRRIWWRCHPRRPRWIVAWPQTGAPWN